MIGGRGASLFLISKKCKWMNVRNAKNEFMSMKTRGVNSYSILNHPIVVDENKGKIISSWESTNRISFSPCVKDSELRLTFTIQYLNYLWFIVTMWKNCSERRFCFYFCFDSIVLLKPILLILPLFLVQSVRVQWSEFAL